MPRWNLSDFTKKSAKNQAEVIAQMGPKTALPVSSAAPTEERAPEPKERAPRPIPEPTPKPSALDSTPIYISADILGHILDSFAGAYYTAGTDTQRKAVIKHALQALAHREANPHSIP